MSLCIVGLGSEHGDDRLGFAAVQALAGHGLPAECALHTCAHPATELLPLLAAAQHAILIDAMVDGGPAGRVLRCRPGELAPRPGQASSHGVSVDEMLALARVLGLLPPALTLIGVTMDPAADPHAPELSPAVRAALPALIEQILAVAATALAETEVPA